MSLAKLDLSHVSQEKGQTMLKIKTKEKVIDQKEDSSHVLNYGYLFDANNL